MPSFDVVSELDMPEVNNAVDQANKEVLNRFDFKGVDAKFDLNDSEIVLDAGVDFQLVQMIDILRGKMIKRGVDVSCIVESDPIPSGKRITQKLTLQQGIESALAKKMVKFIKSSKAKVQVAIQGEQLRVSAKKRDDLQDMIAALKEEKWDIPLQFENFRD